MAVLNPLKVVISGRPSNHSEPPGSFLCTVPDFPFDPSRGSHPLLLAGDEIYIDQADFRTEDSEEYFGLAPGKVVGLKYAFRLQCDAYETDAATGLPCLLRCTALPDAAPTDDRDGKPKVAIQWVPAATSVAAEVRLYSTLFTVEEPSDATWESELNPESEVVLAAARVDPSVLRWKPRPEMHFQFERVGFFVVDKDTRGDDALVFNLTVNLKDSKPKAAGAGPGKSRKEEQARQLAEKLARMAVSPVDMFRSQTDLYSQFDDEGMPTHDAAGEKISKSMYKKLRKEWEKQAKLFQGATASGSGGGEAH
jgi:glutaminyl-tRNA synthetase